MQKTIYITGVGVISAQETFGHRNLPTSWRNEETLQLRAIDPNYKDFVPADMLRRMSHIIKMGVAAGKTALKDAQVEMPDAIITGTGLGCVEDTEKFLGTIIKNKEEFLTPTSFIQSTHNTVGGQIALGIKCHNYNFTYVHRNVSFEMALIDAIQQIQSGNAATVLAGAADEITPNSLTILQRLGYYRTKSVLNMNLIDNKNRGSIAGEGAAFFILSTNPGSSPYALLTASDTLFNPPDPAYLRQWIHSFLENQAVDSKTLALLTGHNGDATNDAVYDEILKDNFTDYPILHYKHLCGEYFSASSFAFWLAASILSQQVIPDTIVSAGKVDLPLKHILILNQFNRKNYALTLLSQC